MHDPREQHATALIGRSMGEYLAAPALLDEPAVQQSFLSYFNTIVVSPGDGACLSWSVMRALLLMPPCVREHLSCPAQRFVSKRWDTFRKEEECPLWAKWASSRMPLSNG